MNRTIEVLDAIMGSGKTTGIIKWMVEKPHNKYLYISPLLTEVEERIPESCAELEFVSPNTNNHRTKSEHLLSLLEDGKNVSFTHKMFENLKDCHLRLIKRHEYILVIDEDINFIEPYSGQYNKYDIKTLENSKHIRINEEELGRVEWIWHEEEFEDKSSYGRLKNMCNLGMLHCSKRDRGMLVSHLPLKLIESTNRTIVMTYLFKGSIMDKFMQMKGVTIKDFIEVQLIKTEAQVKNEADNLIDICNTPSTLKLKDNKKFRLSASWYKDTATKEDLKVVEAAVRSACRRHNKYDVAYTLPKTTLEGNNKKITIKGYPIEDCYLFCGIKATNLYAHKTVMIHAFNRYPMQSLTAYLQDYNFPIDMDEYALSELVQWIWRSGIRNGSKISVYFMTKRMQDLFTKWLNDG